MLLKDPIVTYSICEFNQYSKMSKTEKVLYDFSKELEQRKVDLEKNEKLFRTLTYTFALFMSLEKIVVAAPSTGFKPIDTGGWKLTQILQACVFWISLLYTLKSLLTLAVRGEGEMKHVATGFLICIGDYLIPWLFAMVPQLFQF
jgi:hypothetical protein